MDLELEIVRRIRGNVHGTVDVTAFEDKVLEHPTVQRLRRIRQLAFLSFVFPGASHSRFEHSLGVMQLAGITWNKMRANQKRLANTLAKYPDFAALERAPRGGMVHGLLAPTFDVMDDVFSSTYTLQALRLGGLLHDVGHPPFSHSGERFMPSWGTVLRDLKDVPLYVRQWLEMKGQSLRDAGIDLAKHPVRHEVYTVLLVERLLNDVLRDYKGPDAVSARDVVSIMVPDVAPDAGSPLARHGVHRLCHELISGEVDIDRMDYLLRDSRECGVVYGIFDATRIQDSLSLYADPAEGGLHLAISLSGLAAFEDYLRARHSMYLQLYFHKTSVGAEAMMQHLARMLGGWTLPIEPGAYAEIDEYNIEGVLVAAADRVLSGERRQEFQTLMTDLLRNRRIWKRVYEVSSTNKQQARKLLDDAGDVISGMGVRTFEKISSASSLTTFRPRREHEMSRNYLRLIKKDEHQFPRVVPIEDHTSLVSDQGKVHISRIYVGNETGPDGKPVAQAVKTRLMSSSR